jgi:hypothetical protein
VHKGTSAVDGSEVLICGGAIRQISGSEVLIYGGAIRQINVSKVLNYEGATACCYTMHCVLCTVDGHSTLYSMLLHHALTLIVLTDRALGIPKHRQHKLSI